MTWTDSGRPAAVKPAGAASTGRPVELNAPVKISDIRVRMSMSWYAGAPVAQVGVRTTSTVDSTWSRAAQATRRARWAVT
jgi:hypothetical protein